MLTKLQCTVNDIYIDGWMDGWMDAGSCTVIYIIAIIKNNYNNSDIFNLIEHSCRVKIYCKYGWMDAGSCTVMLI